MKVRIERLKDEDRIKYLDALYTAAAGIKGRVDMKAFLRDLLTVSERIMLGRRIIIAEMLLEDKSYDEITQQLGAGRHTVRKVHRWLLDQHSGYEKAIKGLKREVQDRRYRAGYRREAVLRRLKKRYPLYFLLFSGKK